MKTATNATLGSAAVMMTFSRIISGSVRLPMMARFTPSSRNCERDGLGLTTDSAQKNRRGSGARTGALGSAEVKRRLRD
jgi:hypothetical protein